MSGMRADSIIVENDEVLLVRDTDDRWRLPGDTVADGETPRNAAVRAVQEQLGCTGVVRSSWGRLDTDPDQDIGTVRGFITEVVDGEPAPDGDTVAAVDWFDADALRQLSLEPVLAAKRDHLRLLLIRSS